MSKLPKLLSPNVLKSLKLPTPQKSFSNSPVKCLEFPKTPTKLHVKTNFLLNTPNRENVFKKGLCFNEKFVDILGRGSFGTVIKGTYKEQTVAVKIIKNTKFIRECNSLLLPNHENIIKTIDVLMKNQENYVIIIMEYENDCKQLQTLINDLKIDLKQYEINFAIDILNGLEFCHKNNLLHLDLKPTNILVCKNKCKICDFGNSFKLNDDYKKFTHNGTLIYTAPEILLGHFPTEKCDIFSFGIVLWQLNYRKMPYDEFDNNQTIIYQVVKCKLRPECDENFQFYDICKKCWSDKPENRPNFQEIFTKLKKF